MNTPQALPSTSGHALFLPAEALEQLVQLLRDDGYNVIAPVWLNDVIDLTPVDNADQIARGFVDDQDGGHYRIQPGDPELYFEYVVGPTSPKRWFFPPHLKLFSLTINGKGFNIQDTSPQPPKLAFLGVRPCDLAAVAIQDRVFGITPDQETFRCESETYYASAREQSLLIVVNCTRPGGTCFCESRATGPSVQPGQPHDISMTPLRTGFIVHAGSPRGKAILDQLPTRQPDSAELELEELKLARAREHMGRKLDPEGLVDALKLAVEHPRWDEVASRCLACANCTMVCPTCFCSTVSDSSDLQLTTFTRTRHWESCFSHQFSYTHPTPVRNSIRARYRQWLRHKLCTWWDQFGTSGCVGCGRCITWCPVGIDITQEANAIRDSHPTPQADHHEVLV